VTVLLTPGCAQEAVLNVRRPHESRGNNIYYWVTELNCRGEGYSVDVALLDDCVKTWLSLSELRNSARRFVAVTMS
jgi:hypothetical protein